MNSGKPESGAARAVARGVLRLARRMRIERGSQGSGLSGTSLLLSIRRIGPAPAARLAVEEGLKPQSLTRLLAGLARGRPDVVRRAAVERSGPLNVIQLVGREAGWMAVGARLAEAAGADILDINMGCPAREVTGGLSGSALMRDLDHAESLIRATV